MPSGYTADIYDGKNVSFKEFALKCARAFGACIAQRDEDPNELPKLRQRNADNYHIQRLEEAKKWKKPTKVEFQTYVTNQIAYYKDQIVKYNTMKVRYQKMLDDVHNWSPPTKEHVGLKEFMISQLTEGMKFDCSTSGEYYEKELNAIKKLTYQRYVKDMRESNQRDIEYHTEQMKLDNERVDKSNKWISALYKSLEN